MDTTRLIHGMSVALAIAFASSAASAGTWRLSTGADYTSGDYGAEDEVSTLYAPINIKYRGERMGLRLTVPYLKVSGPGTVLDEGGQLVPGPDRTDSGLGDIILAATLYDLIAIHDQRLYVDLTAKVKFGSADEDKGLGTGETDYALQGEWYKDFERVGLFGALGYKVYGDPVGTDLDDAAFASLGGDYRFAPATRAGLIYDYRESAVAGGDALQELTLFVSFAAGNSMSLQPYVLGGLSDSSPDWGAGVMVSWRAGSN